MRQLSSYVWFFISILVLIPISPNAASASPVLLSLMGEVAPGETFEIEFQFNAPPTNSAGVADALVINGGSLNRGLLFSWVDLYADDQLIGSYHGMTNSFGVFTEGSSNFAGWENPTDLMLIWAGAIGRIVFRPVFDPNASDPYMQYQVNWLYAARDTGGGTYDDDYAPPNVIGAAVNPAPVPEPSSLVLLGTGFIGAITRRRRRLKTTDSHR